MACSIAFWKSLEQFIVVKVWKDFCTSEVPEAIRSCSWLMPTPIWDHDYGLDPGPTHEIKIEDGEY